MPISRAAFVAPNYYVAALLEGFNWTGTTGVGTNVPYSFSFSREGGSPFTGAQQTAALSVLQLYSNVANITFSQLDTPSAKLTFSQTDLASGVAGLTTSFFSGSTTSTSEVQVDTGITGYTVGGFGYLVLLHEIGHSLGLKHPGNYSGAETPPFLPAAEDSTDASVMSYNDGTYTNNFSNLPITPMIYDIAAVQFLYGANHSYHAGNDVYTITGALQGMTIWDGAGVDILDASGFSGVGTIDLREGLSNVTLLGQSAVWIAFGANIENAAGGGGNTSIFGNALNNQLAGGGGNDTVSGGAGNDVLFGGVGVFDPTDGDDSMTGDAGVDTMYGNSGNDIMFGGVGIFDPTDAGDVIYGGKGSDNVYGNAGNDQVFGGGSGVDPLDTNDLVYGGSGTDLVFGNGGNDTLFGGGSGFDPSEGSDTIFGGAGDDMIFGNGGNDLIYGNEGNDVIYGGAGNDVYYYGSGSGADTLMQFDNPGATAGDMVMVAANVNGSGILTTADILSRIIYSGGNAILDLGGGQTVTIIGVADNSLVLGDFAIG